VGGKHPGLISAVDILAPNWQDLAAMLLSDESADDGGGADGVIDGVGGPVLIEICQKLVRARGKVVTFGAIAGEPDPAELDVAMRARDLRFSPESAAGTLRLSGAEQRLKEVLALMFPPNQKFSGIIWESISWRDVEQALQLQPSWSRYPTIFDGKRSWEERRVGRILLKFD